MKRARGGGKGKAKAATQVQHLSGTEALQIKQIIDAGGQPDLHTLLSLLNSAAPCEELYAGCKGKSGNANCLCGLVPNPGASRRSGLWAKQPAAVAELGQDPATLKREKLEHPVGLRNLGNTCYVNSVLQCLFANQAFRRAVYAVRPPLAEQPVVKELRQLFVELECGATSPVDPQPLVGSLQLDHGVQQDGQEFMKLLLTLLEAQFARQPDLRDVIPSLFRGQSGYETVCQVCQRPSESSSRSVSFYELDLPVKGFTSLQDSLSTLLAPEFLCGDNQYSCDFCAAKVDATRQLRLRALPPMLCLSLQRFVFDYNKMDRVKANNKFAFPLVLDMAHHLGASGQQAKQGQGAAAAAEPLLYDLVAILIHKGGSAMHGHYVAHINMDGEAASAATAAAAAAAEAAARGGTGGAGGGWWRFDDEGVARMKAGPCGSADHGAAGPKRPAASAASEDEEGGGADGKGQRGRGRGRGGGRGRGRGGAGGVAAKQAAGKGRGRGRGRAAAAVADDVVSLLDGGDDGDDAIEVMAEQEKPDREDPSSAMDVDEQGESSPAAEPAGDGKAANCAEIVSQNAYLLVYRQRGAELPLVPLDAASQQWLAEARGRLEEEYQRRCSEYAAAKEGVVQRTQQRQEEVRSVVEAAVVLQEDDPGRYVASAWLHSWAEADGSSTIDPIDNSALLCTHGKLDPNKTQDMRHISTPAWEQLRSSYKGGPELQPRDACPTCLAAKLDAVVASEDNQERRDHFLALAAQLEEAAANGEEADDASYFVSRPWLAAWQKRSGRSMGNSSPTDAITCPHGQLAPEQLGKQSKRVGVPTDFWGFLKRCWDAAVAEKQRKQQQKAAKKPTALASTEVEVVALDSDGDMSPPDAKQPPQPSLANGVVAAAAAPDGANGVHEPEAGAATAEGAAVNGNGTGSSGTPGGAQPLVEFGWDSEECPHCLVELQDAAEMAQGLRGRRDAERAVLAHLVNPYQPPPLEPGRAYSLVPASFMEQWRAYMSQAGRRGPGPAATQAAVAQPPSLEACMAGVLCSCHTREDARLAYPPPALVKSRRGRWGLAEHEEGAAGAAAGAGAVAGQEGETVWQLLDMSDWHALVHGYGMGNLQLPSGGVTVIMRVSDDPAEAAAATGASCVAAGGASGLAAGEGEDSGGLAAGAVAGDVGGDDGDYEAERLIGDDYRPARRKQDRGGGKFAWLEVQPPVCQATVVARRDAARLARLTYRGEDIMVEVVGSEEEARQASRAALAPGGERKSKRARKGRAPLTLGSSDTLRTLRLRLYEAVDVHPLNARLFVRGEELAHDAGATLAACEIFPGEEIKVVDTQEHDAGDYASIVALYGGDAAGVKRGRQREQERGFHGTALHGLLAVGDGDDGMDEEQEGEGVGAARAESQQAQGSGGGSGGPAGCGASDLC
ncbi:hypothetical protein N2152v2_010771 [Parachlorella kessleri]